MCWACRTEGFMANSRHLKYQRGGTFPSLVMSSAHFMFCHLMSFIDVDVARNILIKRYLLPQNVGESSFLIYWIICIYLLDTFLVFIDDMK